jgi:hypothetical protein
MTVDDFLELYVKNGTPVTIIDGMDGEIIDSFVLKESICAWQGHREVLGCTVTDGRLEIMVE